MLNIYKIIEKTQVEGPGQRFCIWTQGCKKHCSGCFARETWDFGTGKDYCVQDLYKMICEQKEIEGVTFLGGEPFEQAEELAQLAGMIKQKGLSIVCFTGYRLEELKNKHNKYIDSLLENIDLLIDGGFEQEKYDLSRPWVGSSNQRYIFLTDFYQKCDIARHKNKIEMRLSKDGKLEINGMGNFDNLKKDFCLQLGKNIVE